MQASVNYSGYDDHQLIKLYKETGELKILAELFERYMPLIYGVCLKYLKDREESKDSTMHIFEKLISNVKDHDVKNFKSWLYVIVKNHCLMQLRSKKSKMTEQISEYFMETTIDIHPEGEVAREVNVLKLEKCIEELGNEQKWCVKLFYIQQKCYKEIVEETGYDDKKVKSYIQNGKRNLKLCMDRNG